MNKEPILNPLSANKHAMELLREYKPTKYNREQRRRHKKRQSADGKNAIVILDELIHSKLHTLQECITPTPAFELNMRLILSVLLKDEKINCNTCQKLGIIDYCHEQPCIETIIDWAKEQ